MPPECRKRTLCPRNVEIRAAHRRHVRLHHGRIFRSGCFLQVDGEGEHEFFGKAVERKLKVKRLVEKLKH